MTLPATDTIDYTPGPTTVNSDSYIIEQGTRISGDNSSLHSEDDNNLVVSSSDNRVRVRVGFDTDADPTAVEHLTIKVVSRQSTTGKKQRILRGTRKISG